MVEADRTSALESGLSVGRGPRAGLAEGRGNWAVVLTKGSGHSGEGGPLSEGGRRESGH